MSRRISVSRAVFNIFNYSGLGLLALLCIYPFWYIFIYTISEPTLGLLHVSIIPKGFTLFNYVKAFEIKGINSAFLISVARTVIGTIFTVLGCSFLGYLFSKNEMPARKFLYRMLVITMYIAGGLIPTYLTISALGLKNTFWVYVIPGNIGATGLINAYFVILIKTFIEQLPASLEESAQIEGAGYLTIFAKIVFPLSIPIIATVAIFSAVSQWNSWFDNYIFVTNPKLETLQYLLYKFLNESSELAKKLQEGMGSFVTEQEKLQLTPKVIRMTITFITVLPIFMVYPFMQKYFIRGIMIGAVKG